MIFEIQHIKLYALFACIVCLHLRENAMHKRGYVINQINQRGQDGSPRTQPHRPNPSLGVVQPGKESLLLYRTPWARSRRGRDMQRDVRRLPQRPWPKCWRRPAGVSSAYRCRLIPRRESTRSDSGREDTTVAVRIIAERQQIVDYCRQSAVFCRSEITAFSEVLTTEAHRTSDHGW